MEDSGRAFSDQDVSKFVNNMSCYEVDSVRPSLLKIWW